MSRGRGLPVVALPERIDHGGQWKNELVGLNVDQRLARGHERDQAARNFRIEVKANRRLRRVGITTEWSAIGQLCGWM